MLEEEAELNQGGGELGKMGGLRRRRRTYSRTLSEHGKPNKQYGQDPEQHGAGTMGTDSCNVKCEQPSYMYMLYVTTHRKRLENLYTFIQYTCS